MDGGSCQATVHGVANAPTKDKNEIKPFAATWMDLKLILLSEVNQKDKEIPYIT